MSKAICILLMPFVIGCASNAVKPVSAVADSEFIGRTNRSLSSEVFPYESGACAGPAQETICDYAISWLQTKDRKPYVILAERLLGMDGSSARYLITDEVYWPEEVISKTNTSTACWEGEVAITGIIAIIEDGPGDWPALTKYAWRIDYETGKLDPISTEKLKCYVGV